MCHTAIYQNTRIVFILLKLEHKEPILPAEKLNNTLVSRWTYIKPDSISYKGFYKMKREEIVDFENLYDSMNKCKKNVSWKTSTKHFTLNGIEECLKMEESLKSGTWTNGKPHEILITYPKKRQGLAISFKDRVYQRSLNDNELYPKMTNSFIYDNCACQKGKGTSFARQRLTTFITHVGEKTHGFNREDDSPLFL